MENQTEDKFKNWESFRNWLTELAPEKIVNMEEALLGIVSLKGESWDIEFVKSIIHDARKALKEKQESESKEIQAGKSLEQLEKILGKGSELKEKLNTIITTGRGQIDEDDINDLEESFKNFTCLGEPELKPYTMDDFYNDIKNYNPLNDFRPKLFNEIPFPCGTLSVIGAYTGRGKTTALINLAREVLSTKSLPSDNSKERKVVFITLEMSSRELFFKLLLSTMYADATDEEKKGKANETGLDNGVNNPDGKLYRYLYKLKFGNDPLISKKVEDKKVEDKKVEDFMDSMELKTFDDKAEKAKGFLDEAITQKRLVMFEAWRRGVSQERIISLIEEQEKGTLVLLDYLQRMPEAKNTPRYDSYMRIKKISDALFKAAATSGSVLIAGAQFSRDVLKGDKEKDNITEASFRESADIEQDAHNAIGIGKYYDEEKACSRFCKVLKTRGSGGAGDIFDMEFNGKYSLLKFLRKTSNNTKGTQSTDDRFVKKGNDYNKERDTITEL